VRTVVAGGLEQPDGLVIVGGRERRQHAHAALEDGDALFAPGLGGAHRLADGLGCGQLPVIAEPAGDGESGEADQKSCRHGTRP
jgi:hypothetical protein